ncbi:MAG TPA: hypothetical protein VFL94_09360 [Actinomycetales bacterium]|nr:hypothetical protein [Actinomycetales bacterium]
MTSVDVPLPAPVLRGERTAGLLLARTGVALGLWLLLGSVVVVPLSLVHLWRPAVVLPVLLLAGALAVRLVRRLPAPPAPVWAVALVVASALGGAVWVGSTHAEHVVLRRDAGTYALSAQNLATEHQLDVDVAVAALGGTVVVDDPDVTVASPGFYEVGHGTGTHVVPQFLPATPAWLSVGYWLGGWTGLLIVPAFAIGAALLAFGALTARLVGPRWSAVATVALTLCQPVLHAGRSTYSEPFALVVLLAGLVVLAEATMVGASGRWHAARGLGLLAGLVIGGVGLVRVDALREVALLVPVCALLVIRHHGAGRPLALGLAVSTVVSAAWALLVSRPYLSQVSGSLVPLLAGTAAVVAVSALWWGLARRGASVPDGVRRRLPGVLAGLVLAVALVLASRPLWLVVRQSAGDPGSRVVAGLQLRQGLPVDGGRTYAEQSVSWLAWWVGVPVLVLALAAAVLLAYRVGRVLAGDPVPAWLGPWAVAVGSTVLTLYRPGITPDHPWADRRFVPVVLPALVLLATGVVAWVVRRARRRWPLTLLAVVGVAGPAALLVPAAVATASFLAPRTEQGEVAAVARACAAFEPTDTAVLLDSRAANEWTQVLRGPCLVPSLVLKVPRGQPVPLDELAPVVRSIRDAGRRPVLVTAESPDPLAALGAHPRQVVDLRTTEDQRLLDRRPDGLAPLDVDLWVAPAPE